MTDTSAQNTAKDTSAKTRGLAFRILAATVAVVLVSYAARWLAVAAVPEKVEVAPLEAALNDYPMTFDNWRGETVELDPKVFLATGAACTINRNYTAPGNQALSLHMALFDQQRFQLPHPPELCYSGAGWRQLASKDVPLELPNGTTGSVRILRFDRDGATITVLYTYQLGGPFDARRNLVRQFFWQFQGRPARPALVKVMLQAPGQGPEVEATLRQAAADVLQFAWDAHEDAGLLANQ